MKKILILIPRMGGGGAERVVSIIANRLSAKYKIQITTLVSDKSFYALKPEVNLTSALYLIDRRNKLTRLVSMGKNFINAVFFVRKTIKRYKPDIVFSLLEEMDIVTWFATRNLTGVKWICSERNDPTQRNGKLQKLLEYIYHDCHMMVCQSQTVADYYAKLENKMVIPNPVDLNHYPERVNESAPCKIVSVGRLVPQKNIDLLIRAFAKISRKYPDVTVSVYGEGVERKKLETTVSRLQLSNRFFFPGASKAVLNDIRDAAIFAFPTNYEGFPNVLVEAIAMGIPVVTTNFATGIAKEIVNQDVGIVVPCGDVNAFALALSKLLSNQELRMKIRNESYKAVEPFAVESVITKWEFLFKKLLEN